TLLSSRWLEETDPHVFFHQVESQCSHLNAAYKADAEAGDPDDVDNKADSVKAISMNVVRDIVQVLLPSEYSSALGPNIKRKTTYWDLKEMVLTLHADRQSRDLLQEIAARQASAFAVGQPQGQQLLPPAHPGPPAPSYPAQQQQPDHAHRTDTPSGQGSGSWREPRRRTRRSGNSDRAAKIDVKRYSGYDKWRGSTFTDANGAERFKIPADSCFGCFKQGHRVAQCPLESPDERARSRVAELARDRITVPVSDAMALHVVDLSGETQ
ncbi:hypothetical protein DMC30DRAFT_82855, partial [Rhodotorula diobovata]